MRKKNVSLSEAKRRQGVVAEGMGIKIRWGGDWNGNFDLKDQNFYDLPHFEVLS